MPHVNALIGHAKFRGYRPIPGEMHLVFKGDIGVELVQTSQWQFKARYAGGKHRFERHYTNGQCSRWALVCCTL